MSRISQPPASPTELGVSVPPELEASFMRALNSNACYTDTELAAFDADIIAQAKIELEKREAEISRAHAALKVLRNARRRLRDNLLRWCSVASAIRRFPPEILTEIFQLVYPRFDIFARDVQGPWTLTHVCRAWRQVALDTPSLWSQFFASRSLTSDVTVPRSHIGHVDRLHHILSCGSSYPLSLHCDLTRHQGQDEAHYRMLLELLENSSRRWKDAHLILDDTLLALLSSRSMGCLPLLEKLTIDCVGSEIVGDTTRFFALAPSLKDVALRNLTFKNFVLPLPQLQHLRLEWNIDDNGETPFQPSLTHLLRYLTACPVLQSLSVVHDFDSRRQIGTPATTQVVHQSITVLRVSDMSLLASITLPCLRELYIVEGDHSLAGSEDVCPPEMTEVIAEFFERSKCPLEALTVQDISRSFAEEFLRALDLVPTLRRLEIQYNRWSDSKDEALIQILDELEDPMLPDLTAFHIVINGRQWDYQPSYEVLFVGTGLRPFVQRRWVEYEASGVYEGPSCARIKTVHVSIDLPVAFRTNSTDYDIDLDLLCMRGFKEDGLDISVCATSIAPDNKPFVYPTYVIDKSWATGRKLEYV